MAETATKNQSTAGNRYEQTVALRYIHMTPRKVRLIATPLRGLSVTEAEAELLFRVQRAAKPILKLLRSAVANARSAKNVPAEKLFIKEIQVGQGPMLKRFLPRAFGRATEIQKKMSHLFITVAENPQATTSRFVIAPKVKKVSKKSESGERHPKKGGEGDETTAGRRKGFFRRIFNRKAI